MLLTDEGVLYSWTAWLECLQKACIKLCQTGIETDFGFARGTNNEFGQLGRACHNQVPRKSEEVLLHLVFQDKMLKPAPIIGGIKSRPHLCRP